MNWGFRVASSADCGLGHLVRSIALAEAMPDPVTFYIDPDGPGLAMIDPARFGCVAEDETNGLDALGRDAKSGKIGPVVFDGYDIDRQQLAGIAQSRFSLAISDGGEPFAVQAQLVHGFLTPQRANDIGGPDYALLPAEFSKGNIARPPFSGGVLQLVVGFGAVDSQNLTGLVLKALAGMDTPYEVSVMLPPQAPHYATVAQMVSQLDNVALVSTLPDQADLAIGAPGVSLLERTARGIPSLLVVQNAQQSGNAAGAKTAGVAIVLGNAQGLTKTEIADAITDLCKNPEGLAEMSQTCRNVVDGKGAARAAHWMTDAANAYESKRISSLRTKNPGPV